MTGEADALLHIRAADMRHFEQVVERISAEPLVVRTRSVIVLSRLVHRPDTAAAAVPPGRARGPRPAVTQCVPDAGFAPSGLTGPFSRPVIG